MNRFKICIVVALLGVVGLAGGAAVHFSNLLRESKIAEENYWGNEADMIGYFEGAKTLEMELDAAKALNERFPGYTVRAFDASGAEFVPNTAEDYDAVHRVLIAFVGYDDVASRTILNRKSVDAIYLLD